MCVHTHCDRTCLTYLAYQLRCAPCFRHGSLANRVCHVMWSCVLYERRSGDVLGGGLSGFPARACWSCVLASFFLQRFLFIQRVYRLAFHATLVWRQIFSRIMASGNTDSAADLDSKGLPHGAAAAVNTPSDSPFVSNVQSFVAGLVQRSDHHSLQRARRVDARPARPCPFSGLRAGSKRGQLVI